MFKYFVYWCDECQHKYEEMKDDKKEDIQTNPCPACGTDSTKVPYANIAKLAIEEITHGGRITGGKLYRHFTGLKELKEERALEKQIARAKKKGDTDTAIQASKELGSKRRESVSKLKK